MQAWLKGQPSLSLSDLADALCAISDELEGQDRRSTRPRGEQPETTLARVLVTELRAATGAPWSYQDGGPIPGGGKPFYDIVAAFMNAAGWKAMDIATVKGRLEAKGRAKS